MKTTRPLPTISFVVFFSSLVLRSNAYKFHRINLTSGANGPESLAFDCDEGGPYTGVSDGRIFKWGGRKHGWSEFAVTSQDRKRDLCDGSNDPKLEHICGRPLGLQFNKATCELYIADAYFGLFVVSRYGGVATLLASRAEGVPLRFTNSVDIDTDDGAVYFTDTSMYYQRREFLQVIQGNDSSGRLLKYDMQSKNVTVLLRGLPFANGVALSKDHSYILIAETTSRQVLRYWLKGSKANTVEVFAHFPSYIDNIRRNTKGEFWVALNNGKRRNEKSDNVTSTSTEENIVATRIDEEGQILEVLKDNYGGKYLEYVSEVLDANGKLWVGSVRDPFLSFSKT
ncbi:hypothetical protein GIB67_038576 [Kingdonia uniflora]|uniref:Strictosidine synthase conserved region domain-containing protein n=1 Tax=Kingdonia uniflora TaxID=39325 RepID=A0A7J7NPH5_9MAGN|nr:hypothetical protein GIB67_038576 [Kingdonia uniflora]